MNNTVRTIIGILGVIALSISGIKSDTGAIIAFETVNIVNINQIILERKPEDEYVMADEHRIDQQEPVWVLFVSNTDNTATIKAGGGSGTGEIVVSIIEHNDTDLIEWWHSIYDDGYYTFTDLPPNKTFYVYAVRRADNIYYAMQSNATMVWTLK